LKTACSDERPLCRRLEDSEDQVPKTLKTEVLRNISRILGLEVLMIKASEVLTLIKASWRSLQRKSTRKYCILTPRTKTATPRTKRQLMVGRPSLSKTKSTAKSTVPLSKGQGTSLSLTTDTSLSLSIKETLEDFEDRRFSDDGKRTNTTLLNKKILCNLHLYFISLICLQPACLEAFYL
jgi:hypothetical protein